MPSRARLMASSATRWVRWRTKVKAHVLALICPSHACCSGCGSPLAPSWQAPRACKRRKAVRYTSRTTPHVTCVTRHAQNAKPTSRCRTVAPWSTTVAPWSTTMRRVFHPETNGVKASPHRHKRVLSHARPLTHLTHGISTRRPFHPIDSPRRPKWVMGGSSAAFMPSPVVGTNAECPYAATTSAPRMERKTFAKRRETGEE